MVLCGISLFKHIHYQTKRKKQKAKETKEKKRNEKENQWNAAVRAAPLYAIKND